MSERLPDAVRAHYEGERPSPEVLRRLAALEAPASRRRASIPRIGWAVGAAAAGLALLWVLGSPPAPGGDLGERVAAEIALNHEKLVEPDVQGNALPALIAALDRLDFAPRAPARLAAAGLRFTGARYCSLQGQLAVQLQLEDAAGRRVTLYQTQRSERFEPLPAGTHRVGDTRVELWVEDGVVLGLATAAS